MNMPDIPPMRPIHYASSGKQIHSVSGFFPVKTVVPAGTGFFNSLCVPLTISTRSEAPTSSLDWRERRRQQTPGASAPESVGGD